MCSLMHESSHACMKIDKKFRGSGRLLYHMTSVLNYLFLFKAALEGPTILLEIHDTHFHPA